MKRLLASALLAATSSCAFFAPAPREPEPWATESGLTIVDIKLLEGEPCAPGDEVSLHYALTIEGEPIDSSRNRGIPLNFQLGAQKVVPGFDEGVTGMTAGSIRKLVVPPALGYGERGAPPLIPPNSTLHFDIELMDITRQLKP